MKLSVILAALAGLAVAAWFVIHVGVAAVVGAVASIGWAGFAILCVYALVAFVVLGAAWFVLMPSAPFWDFVWGRIVRDAAGEVLPFSQIGGILVGVRALILRGIAAPAFHAPGARRKPAGIPAPATVDIRPWHAAANRPAAPN